MFPMTGEEGTTARRSALLHLGFVATGVVTTLLGPILPSLSSRWALTDAQAGYLFTVQFVGSMLGVALSGRVIERFEFRRALAGGYALMAVGVAMLALLPWPLTLAAVFTYGMAFGIVIPATNLCISDANPDRRAAALNILNLAWGIGAVLSAPLVSLATRIGSVGTFVLLLAIFLGAFAWAVLLAGSGMGRTSQEKSSGDGITRRPRLYLLGAIGAIFYLYVGTESAVGGWIASYAKRIGETPSSVWLFAPSFFWGALLAGRAASAAILRRVSEVRVAMAGLAIAIAGIAILILSHSNGAVFIGATLVGGGLAPVYPIAIALLSQRCGAASPGVAPVMFALASVGGATLPWTIGAVSTHFGHLRPGLFIPLSTTALMIMLYAVATRDAPTDESTTASPSEVTAVQ